MKLKRLYDIIGASPVNMQVALVTNLLLSLVLFMLGRVVFLAMNYEFYGEHLTMGLLAEMFRGGLMFDLSAMVYVNALYILMMLLPWSGKEKRAYQLSAKVIFCLFNGIALVANLTDTVYFKFTGRRTTATIFQEFENEGNIGTVLGSELINHWFLVVLFGLLMWGVWKLYYNPVTQKREGFNKVYYITQVSALLIAIPLCVVAIRGGIGKAVRPIAISNANQYINRPIEAGVVLNTPFSIIRTIGKKPFEVPDYLSEKEMEQTFTPLHQPKGGEVFTPKNVVVFILESFGTEYVGVYNQALDEGNYKGYTPFLDSLITKSYSFDYSYGNGRKSIDGMPSVLSSIPMFVEPFFVTPAALNKVSGIAGELTGKKGYYSAFFHGAQNGSMGFQAFARATGFKDYFGKTEYNQEPAYNGDDDFDGTWAIWDEEFFQFFCDKITSFRQPFVTAMFSATSHHPFAVPERYQGVFPKGTKPIHQCIGYTDNALRLFFEKAKKQPWFNNTLFVITADHTNQTDHSLYQTDYGVFAVPVIFYDPGAGLQGRGKGIAQQIDIMPTVLGYLGYDQPYIAFGCDLFQTPVTEQYAVNYFNGVYQYFKGDYILQFDGEKVVAVYDYKTDPLQKHNIVGRILPQKDMERELKAIIQQYMTRMNGDALVP